LHWLFLAAPADPCACGTWASCPSGSRFKSQALLDEGALLTCIAYVHLNPVRAGISQCLEDFDFTSFQERIQAYQQNQKNSTDKCSEQPSQLLPFDAHPMQDDDEITLPMNLIDYLTLVE